MLPANSFLEGRWLIVGALVPLISVRALAGRRLPLETLIWFWICGGAAAYLAGFIEDVIEPHTHWMDFGRHPYLLAFGVVAPIEEIAKYALIYREIVTRPSSTPRTMAAVGLAIGGGFASLENLNYLIHANGAFEQVAMARFIAATPFHLANGVIAGLLAWQAIRSRQPSAAIIALVLVIFLHGAYDAPLFAGGEAMAKYAFVLGVTVAIAAGVYRRAGDEPAVAPTQDGAAPL